MGCDIHATVEKKHNGKWVMVNRLGYMDKACDRNYRRFAEIASVRGDGPRQPLGVPDDASDSTLLYVEQYGDDGHSHSYMPLKEAAQVWLQTEYGNSDSFRDKYPEYHYFGIDAESYDDYRIVFFFDN